MGRRPFTAGEAKTLMYLETSCSALSLEPGNGKSYRQLVKIAGVKAQPEQSSLQLLASGKPLAIEFGKDWIWAPGDAVASHQFDTDIVFVGYGISAPEEKWDDYKGQDVSGKLLVMMVNDPQATAQEPARFGGKALTYYGRWTYKYEEAKRRGAAGVLLIHTDASASYGWSVVQNGGTAEKFQLQGAALGAATRKHHPVVAARFRYLVAPAQ